MKSPGNRIGWNIETMFMAAGIILLVTACPVTFFVLRDVRNENYSTFYILMGLVIIASLNIIFSYAIIMRKVLKGKTGMVSPSIERDSNSPVSSEGREISIVLWARDEVMAHKLISDQQYLMGALVGDNSSNAKNFFRALGEGGSLSSRVASNPTKGGFDVELTVSP